MIRRLTLVSLAAVALSCVIVYWIVPRPDLRKEDSGSTWQEQLTQAPEAARVSPPEQKVSADLLSPEDRQKLNTLGDIIAAKNDNDPRLDSDFRSLSVPLKQAMRAKYYELPAENRAGRGTVVFLLGREIRSPEDVDFLASVVSEKPCLSFENCSQVMPEAQEEGADHHAGINNISLSYPELTSLMAVRNWLEQDRRGPDNLSQNSDLRLSAERFFKSARGSENRLVAQRAQESDPH